MGELSMRKEGLCYRGVHHNVDTLSEYFELPYEIETYGREKGLLIAFLAFWKSISEEFLTTCVKVIEVYLPFLEVLSFLLASGIRLKIFSLELDKIMNLKL